MRMALCGSFNSIRLPFNMEDWIADPTIPQGMFDRRLNPALVDATYRQMLRIVIQTAAKRQILILLTCHRLRRSYADETHPEAWPGSWNGLWWENGDISGVTMSEHNVAALWGEIAHSFCDEWNLFATECASHRTASGSQTAHTPGVVLASFARLAFSRSAPCCS